MGLQFSEIDDAVLLTQENLIKKGAFVDLQTDLQDFVAVREMWKQRQKKFDGGNDWEFQAQVDHNHSAQVVELYETDGSSITDTMIEGKVSPRHVNAHYIYDQREKAFQRGGKAIVDLIQTRYVAMMVSLYTLMEQILWGKPVDSTDTKTPYGIAYYVVKNAAEGFNGGLPAGFTDRAGITHARYNNYSGSYEDITREDLFRKMRRAHRQTNFRSPISHAQPTLSAKTRNGIYMNDTVIGLVEEELEKNNMSLGNDVASKDGRATFKSTPLTYAPYLDSDTENPIYMLDWMWLCIGVLEGWENNLSAPYMVPNKSKVRRVDLDCTLQLVSTNNRRQTVLHNPA
jgi:hypothetical protein